MGSTNCTINKIIAAFCLAKHELPPVEFMLCMRNIIMFIDKWNFSGVWLNFTSWYSWWKCLIILHMTSIRIWSISSCVLLYPHYLCIDWFHARIDQRMYIQTFVVYLYYLYINRTTFYPIRTMTSCGFQYLRVYQKRLIRWTWSNTNNNINKSHNISIYVIRIEWQTNMFT